VQDKLKWITDELDSLKEAGLLARIRTISSPQGAWLTVDGDQVLNFSSNNYLGLANHPRLVDAAEKAIHRYGIGPAAVRSIAGTMDLHLRVQCEHRYNPGAGRAGRCCLFRRAQPCQHHRRLPAFGGDDYSLQPL